VRLMHICCAPARHCFPKRKHDEARLTEGNRSWWSGWASNPVGGAMRCRVGSTPASFRHNHRTPCFEKKAPQSIRLAGLSFLEREEETRGRNKGHRILAKPCS